MNSAFAVIANEQIHKIKGNCNNITETPNSKKRKLLNPSFTSLEAYIPLFFSFENLQIEKFCIVLLIIFNRTFTFSFFNVRF